MRQTMEQHKAEYRARPISERLHGVFAEVSAGDKPVACGGCGATDPTQRCVGCLHDFKPSPAKAYKPAHGGLSGMTHDGAHLIVIPMARWHQAANDDHCGPVRAA